MRAATRMTGTPMCREQLAAAPARPALTPE